MKDLKGARVVVVGMAKSGMAAVELLREHQANVIAMDQKPAANERIEVHPQDPALTADADLVVLSPGVPTDSDVAEAARKRGIQTIGDLELASWFLKGDIIGITGANGKTTTTAMTGHILQSSGIPAQVGGNIGTPPCSMVATSKEGQWNVLELSSFQLETTDTFRAHIGAVLNVTPDHLDRHHTFGKYAAAKGRLFANQTSKDFAVLNADDTVARAYSTKTAGHTVWFSSQRGVREGARILDGWVILHGQPLMQLSEIPLRGTHNVENTMAAALIATLAGASHEHIRSAVMTFPGVEHRLEFVRELDGVSYYNDSKATNVDATLKAIAAFDGGLWIVLGGKDKGSDYAPLASALSGKARTALLIGAAAEKIASQLGKVPAIQCGTLENAVREAHARARRGDTILLAPACASFDQFDNYEHRGREFKRFVAALEPSL